LQYIHAAIVGDSGFLVVRDGAVVYRSPVQLHDTNRPYQLGASDKLDDPSGAEVCAFSFFYTVIFRKEYDLKSIQKYLFIVYACM